MIFKRPVPYRPCLYSILHTTLNIVHTCMYMNAMFHAAPSVRCIFTDSDGCTHTFYIQPDRIHVENDRSKYTSRVCVCVLDLSHNSTLIVCMQRWTGRVCVVCSVNTHVLC